MPYAKRLKTLFHRPSESFQEIIKNPSFLKTSVLITISSVLYSTVAEYGLFKCLTAHFIAAYALMFTLLWLLPTLISMLILKIFGKKFSSESYIEANALSFFSVFTYVFLCLVSFTVYSHLLAEPRRTVYHAIVYYNQWLPLAVLGGIGAIVAIHRMVQVGRQVAKAKTYQLIIAWVVAWAILLYIAYLFFRGWL